MAPNKKYLSLEEAAVQLGLKPDELIRLREKGEVRGFADRGTWKFKADDIAEYRRRQQPDSDPDLPLIEVSDEDDFDHQPTASHRAGDMNSDSDVRLVLSDDSKKKKLSGSSAEVAALDLMHSDSDVRLVEPPKRPKLGSDSDVKIVKPKAGVKSDSDSDVKMVDSHEPDMDSDSDVKLTATAGKIADSDSDVRLAPPFQSDSDVQLIGKKPKKGEPDSDSDVMLLPRGSRGGTPSEFSGKLEKPPLDSRIGFELGRTDKDAPVLDDADDSSITLAGDSGIQLPSDSGIQLAGDSGIQLAGDSGIRLGGDSSIRLGGDSGIRLSEDSGVQLMQPADSGISLEGPDSEVRFVDSGITLGDDSGINLVAPSSGSNLGRNKRKGGSSKIRRGAPPADEDDMDSTNPMLLPELDDDDSPATSPLLSVGDSLDAESLDLEEFDSSDTSEMQSLGDSGQNVVIFEDDEDDAPPVAKRGKKQSVEDGIFELDEDEEGQEEQLEELEVSDEDLSGANEFDDLAFDDSGEESGEGFTEGSSQFEISMPRKIAVAHEVEWSTGFCGLLFVSLCVSIVGALVSADLLRTVWAQGQDSTVDQGIAWLLAGFWK